MPSTNQYDSLRAVAVQPYQASPILYGFKTNVKAATSTACGHSDVSQAPLPANLVFGVNNPKPGRASRLNGDEYDSSFFDYTVYQALKADGWRTSKPYSKYPRSTTRSVAVYISINSAGNASGPIKYAWNMQRTLFTAISAELEALGIENPGAGDLDLVFGCNSPVPPRATKVVGANTYTTFVSPARIDNLPAGWAAGGSSKLYINI